MAENDLELKRRRLRMAASRRGFLETELALKPFIQTELEKLEGPELLQFELLLGMEDLDLWEVLSGRKEPPRGVSGGFVDRVRAHISGA